MKEKRSEARMLCSEMVEVRWNRLGRQRQISANLEDISASGVCLQAEEAIPAETVLSVLHPSGEFTGRVRYCVYLQIGYFVGVQFEPGWKWSPDIFKPQHLLDLRDLIFDCGQQPPAQPEEQPKPQ
jgi:hypothetical protein